MGFIITVLINLKMYNKSLERNIRRIKTMGKKEFIFKNSYSDE
jgi:hypothetical protein